MQIQFSLKALQYKYVFIFATSVRIAFNLQLPLTYAVHSSALKIKITQIIDFEVIHAFIISSIALSILSDIKFVFYAHLSAFRLN